MILSNGINVWFWIEAVLCFRALFVKKEAFSLCFGIVSLDGRSGRSDCGVSSLFLFFIKLVRVIYFSGGVIWLCIYSHSCSFDRPLPLSLGGPLLSKLQACNFALFVVWVSLCFVRDYSICHSMITASILL